MIRIGVPKEVKDQENRVGMRPCDVSEILNFAHESKLDIEILVESNAGYGSGYLNEAYDDAGAIIAGPIKVWDSDIVVKVKEPQKEEWSYLDSQIVYGYLHASSVHNKELLANSKNVCYVAYEEQTSVNLLAPMSAIAGRLAVQKGAQCLEGVHGKLLGGIPGTAPAKVVIIGAGVVGSNAMQMAIGMGADVSILDIDMKKLADLDQKYGNRVKTLMSNNANVSTELSNADLVIGAVLLPGKAAPKIIKEEHVKSMKQGSCIVDVAIDEGGCCETSIPTSHTKPTYERHGVTHYCVPNIPALVPVTSTNALCQETVEHLKKVIKNIEGVKGTVGIKGRPRNWLNDIDCFSPR